MTIEIPTNEPLEIVAGDRLQWTRSFDDYLASAGWALTYAFIHRTNTKIAITAAASGDDHAVDEDAATTAAWTAGEYQWQAYVTKGAERYQVDHGTLKILPNFAALSTYDDRTDAQKVLEDLQSAYQTYVNEGKGHVASYSINGKSIAFRDTTDLIKAINNAKAQVRREKQAERIRAGLDAGNNISVRFSS